MLFYWQDNEILFDVNPSQLKMAAGERILERVDPVEDTKANSGEQGCLLMTNLRVIWYSSKTSKLNLSVGLNTFVTITTYAVNSRMKGATDALYLLTKNPNGKFEFIFTPLNCLATSLVNFLQNIHKAYMTTKASRELRLRHHIIQANQLKMMPLEHVSSRVEGVWNLANSQGNLGCFIVTNIRLVWYASMNEYFNISLPYIQIEQIEMRDSKFGSVLVVESTEHSGGYILGFRIDPAARMKQVLQEVRSLHFTQIRNPQLGIVWNSSVQRIKDEGIQDSDANQDEGDTHATQVQCYANYCLENAQQLDSSDPPVLDNDLGLAMEKLPEGMDRKSLWHIIL